MDDSQQYVGRVLDNRYRLDRVVGIGGMAFVYEAFDRKTGTRVALKLLKEKFSDDPRAVKRFINESKSLAVLNHPNIVKIYDISIKVQYKYIVMEYVDGVTLRKYMNHNKPTPWKIAVEFAEQVALALDNAHAHGIIHRDIKPQNIMLMSNGKIKVTDFGIAKMPNSESLTMADKAIGTVYYISPEQASNRNIDARSDIYSLGAMLYEMVTGKMPFTADSPVAIIMQHIQDPPASPSKIAPGIPKGLEQIILCAMEKNPRNRYQSAAQMLRHLRRLKMDEKTVFNIMRPAPLTDTSEIKIKKTTKRSHGHSDNKDNSIEVKKTTPKNTEFPTNKTPLNGENNGSGVTPNTANTGSVKQNAAPKQAGTAKAAGASAKPSPVAPQGRRSKKKNFNYVTTFLVVIIILLILAIWGIIAVVLTPDTSGEMLFSHGISRVAAKSLLYLKQGIL